MASIESRPDGMPLTEILHPGEVLPTARFLVKTLGFHTANTKREELLGSGNPFLYWGGKTVLAGSFEERPALIHVVHLEEQMKTSFIIDAPDGSEVWDLEEDIPASLRLRQTSFQSSRTRLVPNLSGQYRQDSQYSLPHYRLFKRPHTITQMRKNYYSLWDLPVVHVGDIDNEKTDVKEALGVMFALKRALTNPNVVPIPPSHADMDYLAFKSMAAH